MQLRRVGLTISFAVLAAVVAAAPARAAGEAEAGWWTAAPVALAPDAPADVLVVQAAGDAAQPFAYAAIAYELAPGEVPTSLTLTVAAGSLSTAGAALVLCPLTGGFIPNQGGAMADAPSYDCATPVTASPTADGSSYEFDVTGLHALGTLAVAVLPAGATDRVVRTRPGPEALQTTPGATGGPALPPDPLPALGSLDNTPAEAGIPFASATNDALGGTEAASAAPEASSSSAPSATGGDGFAGTPSFGEEDDGSLLAAALLGVLVVVALALWTYAGLPRDPDPVATV